MKALNISEYFLAVEVLSSSSFAQALYDDADVVMEKTILTCHGEDHELRRTASLGMFDTSFFMRNSMTSFQHLIGPAMADLVVDGNADLLEIVRNVVVRIVADLVGFNESIRSSEDVDRLREMALKLNAAATVVHSPLRRDEIRAEVRSTLTAFDRKFLSPAVARHTKLIEKHREGALAELPRNAITGLLLNNDRLKLSPEGFLKEVAFLTLAGVSPTVHGTIHCFHDIFQWCATHPRDRELLLNDDSFAAACIAESLRLHPISPVAWRRVVKPCRLNSGAWLEEGDYAIIDLNSVNRDPSVFGADAGLFQPLRKIQHGVPHFGLTFGAGIHACPFHRFVGASAMPRGGQSAEVSRGIMFQLLRRIMETGAVPNPGRPAQMDKLTSRSFWTSYPVTVTGARKSGENASASF